MKIFYLVLGIPFLVFIVMMITAFGGDENSDYPGGSPAGYTGSPGDGKDCVQCHGGTSTFIEGWITSDVPPEGYTPGATYNLTVTVTGSGDKGFQVSPQDPGGQQLGTLIAGPGTHLNGGTKYVNHSSKSTANPATWDFQWTAPDAGTGEVTFYGAFTVNKPVTRTSTLVVQESALIPLEADATADPEQICTGDSSHLDVTATGGTGSYTYFWTSFPPGFTSNTKDPWVSPTSTTTYFVEVSDGNNTVIDSVDVAVYCLGTEEIQVEKILNVTLYPVPATHHLNVVFQSSLSSSLTVTILDLHGRSFLSREILAKPGSNSFQLEVDGLFPGIYFLDMHDGNEKISRKFIKN